MKGVRAGQGLRGRLGEVIEANGARFFRFLVVVFDAMHSVESGREFSRIERERDHDCL